MGIHYNGVKLVWLNQAAGNATTITWLSPPEGSIGDLIGGAEITTPFRTRVFNGPTPTFSVVEGSLPTGLSLSANGGLAGILDNTDGEFSFTIRATSLTTTADRTFTANVAANLPPVWNTLAGSLGNQFDNTDYTFQLDAIDPEGQPVSFSLVAGSLPPGLFLSNTGVLAGHLGNVTDDTQFFFTLAASDGVASANRAFNFTTMHDIAPIWGLGAGTYDLGSPVEGFFYTTTVAATSSGSLTYALSDGSQLPSGLTFDGNTGVISGTIGPVALDTDYYFVINAQDGIKSTGQNFVLRVKKNRPPIWSSSGLIGSAFGGTFVNIQAVAVDPNGMDVTYSLDDASTLPGDLIITPEGVITGTLPQVDSLTTYSFSLVASDGVLTATRAFSLRALKNLNPVWTTNAALAPGLEATMVTRTLTAIDPSDVQTITYIQNGGTLPLGLDFDGNTGILSGTLGTVDTDTDYSFTITATNGVLTTDQDFTFTLKNNVPPMWSTNAGVVATALALYPLTPVTLSGYDPNDTVPTFSVVSGTLPPGLSLSASGVITGAPHQVGTNTQYDFTVALNDGYTTPVNRAFSIIIEPNLAPVWNTSNATPIASAFESAPVSVTLSATDPESQSIIYGVAPGSSLPSGLSLNASTGVINGSMPAVAMDRTFDVVLYADDNSPNGDNRVTKTFQIKTLFNSPPIWSTTSLPSGIESSNYSVQLAATGVGNGPMIYTVVDGSLPAGITLSRSGLISGVLPEADSDTDYSFTINAFNGIKNTTQDLAMTVTHNVAPVWVSNAGSLGSFYTGNNFNVPLSANDPNGSTVVYSLANATTLPSGVTMTNAGVIAGKFASVEDDTTYNFEVAITDGVFIVTRAFSLTAFGTVAPNWVTAEGSIGTVLKSTFFATAVSATDPQNKAITYSIVSGALPTGLTLNASSGLIAGTSPSVNSNTDYNFTIRASDGVLTSDRAFTITVTAVQVPAFTNPAGSLGSVLSGYTASFSAAAVDPQGLTLTYSILSGSLPTGMILQSDGSIVSVGPLDLTTTDATYNFTVQVDNTFVQVSRAYSITILKNLAPVWTTTAGSLGTENENTDVSIQLVAADPESQTILFSVTSGSVPDGLTLSSSGLLSGTLAEVANTTTYNFTVSVSDSKQATPRSFSYTVQFSSPPIWTTTAGSLGTEIEQTVFTANVVATSDGQPIHYALSNATSLPSGLSIDANTGVISGTLPPVSSDTVYDFTISATSTVTLKAAYRNFSITVENDLPPVWSTAGGNFFTDLAGTSFTQSLLAIDPNGTKVTYVLANGTLPDGVTFDPNATSTTASISGVLPAVGMDTTYSVTIGAGDGSSQVNRSFSFTSELDTAPVWTTNAGSLAAAVTENTHFSINVVAVDPQGKTVTYTLANAQTFPTGLTLASNGLVNGTTPMVANALGGNDLYTFDIVANDGTLTTSRTFTLTIKPNLAPVWSTANGSLGSVVGGQVFTTTVVAIDPEGSTVTYSLANSTTLPTGLSLLGNGVITGRTNSVDADTIYPFTISASDGVKTTNRDFSVDVLFDTTFYDPYANAISLLMNFEGTDNTAVFTDYFGRTMSGSGTAIISNEQHQYGNTAVKFDGSGYVTTAFDSNINFDNVSPWTVEFWVFCNDNTSTTYIISENTDDSNDLNWWWGVKKVGASLAYTFGPRGTGNILSLGTVAVGTWQHVAVTRSGNTIRSFLNGTLIDSGGQSSNANNTTPLVIGAGFNGFIDDLRISQVARYTTSFTPGPAPLPPKWVTNSGVIATGVEGTTITNATVLDITDPYSLGHKTFNVIGSLPSGVSLNATTGVLSGTMPTSTGNAITISVQAEDGNNNLTPIRSFSLLSNAASAPSHLKYSWRFNAANGTTSYNPTVGSGTSSLLGGSPSNNATYVAAPSPHATDSTLFLQSFTTVNTPTSTNFQFLTGQNWTIEFWVDFATAPTNGNNYTILSLAANTIRIFYAGSAWNIVSYPTAFTNISSGNGLAFPAAAAGWNHMAVVKNGTNLTCYMNGVAGTPATVNATIATNTFDSNSVAFNGWTGSTGYALSAVYLRDVNFWDTVKYTENFTPEWNDFLAPIWISNTSLTAFENESMAVPVVAESFGNSALTYSVYNSGVMPGSFTLSSEGIIGGTGPLSNANAVTFTLVATDALGYVTPPRTFSLKGMSTKPVWVTNSAIEVAANTSVSIQLSATDPKGGPITYSLQSGSLPHGTSLSNSGLITGTTDSNSNVVVSTFAVRATTNAAITADQTFNMTVDAADPFMANVVALFPMTGTVGATPTDLKGGTITLNGTGGTITAAQSKWGTTSAQFSLGNFIYQAPALFITGDFTMESWIYPTAAGDGFRVLLSCYSSGGANYLFWMQGTSLSFNGPSSTISGGTIALNSWQHVAVTRSSTTVYLFVNGTLVNSSTAAGFGGNLGTGNTKFGVGGYEFANTQHSFIGYMNDVRITTAARYTSNFSVPIQPLT